MYPDTPPQPLVAGASGIMWPVTLIAAPALAPADAALWAALGEATPAFATMPRPGALHDLAQIRVTAEALGRPHMPWQDFVARVVSERREDDPRQFRYKVVVVTVPRQSGKTTLMGNVLTQRALTRPARRAFYTAQTGKDATQRWKDLVEAAVASTSPLRDRVTLRKAIGSQSLTFPNGSYIAPFAPTPKSLHGYTPHDVMVDEIFSLDTAGGEALMGAIGPAQITLSDRQLWLVSTAGTAESTFLKSWVDAGRASLNDPDTSIAYFDWSLPEGGDQDNPEDWTFHPALGHTVTVDDLVQMHEQHKDSPAEWMRAFMNRWTQTSDTLIDLGELHALQTPQTPPADTRAMTIAYEVALDRSRSAVFAAWDDPKTGRPALRALRVGPGLDWVAPFVLQVRDQLKPRAIGVDNVAASRAVTEQIAHRTGGHVDSAGALVGVDWLRVMRTSDLTTGWDEFKAGIRDGAFSLDDTGAMDDAAQAVVQRTMGQGWAPDRMKSRGPIPEVVAATVALRLLYAAPPAAPQPSFRF